jgi:hypothetical protein
MSVDQDKFAWVADIMDVISGRPLTESKYGLMETSELQEFLADEGTSLIVSGARGMGKSIALYTKAVRMSRKDEVRLVVNHHPFVNRLPQNSILIPISQLKIFESHRAWLPIWKVVIGGLIAARYQKDIGHANLTVISDSPEEKHFLVLLNEAIQNPHSEHISSILGWLVNRNLKPETYESWFYKFEPVITSAAGHSTYCIFIDAIDEAININSPEEIFHEPINARLRFNQLWVSAQTAFADTAYYFRRKYFQKLRVYGSMRPEAVSQFPDKAQVTKSKVKEMFCVLKYDSEALCKIFEFNIARTSKSRLADLSADNPIKKFIGHKTLLNRVVWSSEEKFFDHILRHSFLSPRDVVVIGAGIRDVNPIARLLSTKDVTDAINNSAIGVFHEHIQNVYPPWNPLLEQGFNFLTSNIIDDLEMARIENNFRIAIENKAENLFENLYLRQLIYIPKLDLNKEHRLCAYDPDIDSALPTNIGYCALHPALSAFLFSRSKGGLIKEDFYSHHFVVEPGAKVPGGISRPRLSLLRRRRDDVAILVIDGKEIALPTTGKAHQGAIMLAAMICAIRRNNSPKVSGDQIADEIIKLIEQGVVRPLRVESPLDSQGRMIRARLKYGNERKQPPMAREAKELLKDKGMEIGHFDNYFHIALNVHSKSLPKPVLPSEILISI